jgi:hypothetical protein
MNLPGVRFGTLRVPFVSMGFTRNALYKKFGFEVEGTLRRGAAARRFY